MNNVLVSIKRFFQNKNTVTIIGVVIVLALLYGGYKWQIDNAVAPVMIPVAKVDIQPRTEITKDMISYISVPSISVANNVIRSQTNITGKYTGVNSVVPAGSMFYSTVLVNKDQLPDAAFTDVKDGEIPYQFPVTMDTSYGNSVFPGNKIDIYMKALDENRQVMVGKLLENVEVLAVKDSQGRHVFENTSETRTPSTFIFGVPERVHILLRKASYMYSQGVELFPVPHGGTIASLGEMQVSTQYLETYINNHTVTIPENEVPGSENSASGNQNNVVEE